MQSPQEVTIVLGEGARQDVDAADDDDDDDGGDEEEQGADDNDDDDDDDDDDNDDDDDDNDDEVKVSADILSLTNRQCSLKAAAICKTARPN